MRAAGVPTLLILALAATPAAAAPYSSVSAVGKTGNGIVRFPQPVAYDDSGVADPGAGAPAGPYVYVADQYSFLVQKFTRSGTFVRQWGGFGTATGRFGNASGDTVGGIGGLAVDGQGRVYVLDSYNDRVQQFTPGGAFVRSFGSTGTAPGQFQLGINGGLAIRGSSLFVADQNSHRVQRFTLDAADAWGNVLVSDTGNNQVLRFDAGGAYIDSFGGNGTATGQLIKPAQVSARDGAVLVGDPFNNRIQRYTLSTWALSAPASLGVARGAGATGTLRVSPTGGFARPVALTLSGCPSGAACSATPSTLTPSGGAYPSATLRVQASSSTPRGTYSLRITARTTGPTLERTATVTVTVS